MRCRGSGEGQESKPGENEVPGGGEGTSRSDSSQGVHMKFRGGEEGT